MAIDTLEIGQESDWIPKISTKKMVIATGLALFAMFFGAGNIIFPLYLGANAGQNFWPTLVGFIIGGVGVPFLGLYATSLYQGDYWAFFGRLGKIPAFLLITLLIFFVGPFVAIPRTAITTFNSLAPYFNGQYFNDFSFNFIYCALIFILGYRESKIIEILGLVLSPIKIITFSVLVVIGLCFYEPGIASQLNSVNAFEQGLKTGYTTMDMLAAFFFCSVAFRSLTLMQNKTQKHFSFKEKNALMLKSSLFGALILSLVYIGFMMVAYNHAPSLQGYKAEQMISATATVVLGKFGGLFVGVSVSFACIATALALAEVSSHYLYSVILREKIAKKYCLLSVMIVTFSMSHFEFKTIMHYAEPILNIIYPALIVLCVMNILHKWKGINRVKLPVVISALGSALIMVCQFK